jgi:hypothetical protein
MTSHPLEKWAREIRVIYRSDPSRSKADIEQYLEDVVLRKLSPSEREAILEELAHQFTPPCSENESLLHRESEPFVEFCSLLLGERISVEDLQSEALVGRLASSLNTVFDTLNQIVRVMNSTLLGESKELETIRQIIGADLQGGHEGTSLQTYLNQIQRAFLVSHQAFQQAAQTTMGEILSELDPDRIATLTGGGLRFGPLRKAELFEIYQEKYRICKGSFESGRLMNDLLREFENTCQKIYKSKMREV